MGLHKMRMSYHLMQIPLHFSNDITTYRTYFSVDKDRQAQTWLWSNTAILESKY